MSVRQDQANRRLWAKIQQALDDDLCRDMTRERAEQVRRWRKHEALTLQAIPGAYFARYGGCRSTESDLQCGIRICRIAGEVLDERLW